MMVIVAQNVEEISKIWQQQDYLNGANKMFKKAEELIKQTKNTYVNSDLKKAQKVLSTFCIMNNIKIH